MRKGIIENKSDFEINESYEAETLQQMIARATREKAPIEGGEAIIYTERKDGVEPQYDIRTDRFEIAREAMDKVHSSQIAKRNGVPEKEAEKGEELKQSTDEN